MEGTLQEIIFKHKNNKSQFRLKSKLAFVVLGTLPSSKSSRLIIEKLKKSIKKYWLSVLKNIFSKKRTFFKVIFGFNRLQRYKALIETDCFRLPSKIKDLGIDFCLLFNF